MLVGKKIILGISGSIAAYKSALLTRLLVQQGAEVKVLMTPAAQAFISPLSLSTLSKHQVHSELFSEQGWHNHVELGLWADAFVLAPCTANTLAKLAQGLCDNLVLATYLSARCPVFVAPAMDLDMWLHPATQNNVQTLQNFPKHHILQPQEGELASGLIGKGRMAEPQDIVQTLENFFTPPAAKLQNYRILITSGPTQEALDPVRYLSNHSTGTMGLHLAQTLIQYGAEVVFVSGPVQHYPPQQPKLTLIKVHTAQEMLQAALEHFPQCQGAILAAAVSDYRPAEIAQEKIKKNQANLTLQLVKNPDIAATLGQNKNPKQFLIGFALETENENLHAQNKLLKKNLDFIVLNSLKNQGAGFGQHTNQIQILQRQGPEIRFPLKNKAEVAQDIIQHLLQYLGLDQTQA